MTHIKRFNEILESIATHKSFKVIALPHCSEMQARGYRTAEIRGEWYAFHKDYEADDEIYWLGEDTPYYQYGKKYIATPEVVGDKDNDAFYSIYCKCDPGMTEEQKKLQLERDKEILKRQERIKKEKEKLLKEKQAKAKKKKR